MDRQMTVTEASRHFSDLVNRTYYRGESTMLIRSGEPVAKIVPVGGASLLGRDWLSRWSAGPRLEREDADDFAAELEAARSNLEAPSIEWD
jgi:prevent-host-death family protein